VTERWSTEVRDLFDALVDLDAPGREERLRQLAPDDAVAREVAELLAAAHNAGDFLGVLSVAQNDAPLEPGQTIARRYVIERQLGSGAMGDVYLARDRQLERHVALKFLRAAPRIDAAALHRIVAEARVSARLDHPHVATVYDIAQGEDGRLFIVMAYYAGATLRERIRNGPLQAAEALRIAAQIGDALSAAHAAGIIHRDVKPGNVLFDSAGNVRLADFGVATLAGAEAGSYSVTAGTLAYMSPEQLRNFRDVKPQSDIYAVGMTAYSLLSGSLALDITSKGNINDTIRAIFEQAAVPLRQRAPHLPAPVCDVIDRALAKDPAQRWQTASAMRNALLHCI